MSVGIQKIPLNLLARLYKSGDGDCGICFEYAVHDAINRNDQMALDRVYTAMSRHCHIDGDEVNSILFGMEKSGALQLLETAHEILTDESVLMTGSPGKPIKLKQHIVGIASAFRSKRARPALPSSISGLWKADLFLGMQDTDRWVGTTVKINERDLVGARGLRIGIVPARSGQQDKIQHDERRNLIICPLPHDGQFMEIFFRAFHVVQQLFARDVEMPPEVFLPVPADRFVANLLVQRRIYPVIDVVESLGPISQPELLNANQRPAIVSASNEVQSGIGMLIAPMPNTTAI